MPTPLKFCTRCQRWRATCDFYWNSGKNSWNAWCKGCRRDAAKTHYSENKERYQTPARRAASRRRRIKNRYGLTVEQYDEIMSAGCALCGTNENLHLDHNHTTGAVRGCLCKNHNTGIGFFQDDPELLRAAAAYLEKGIL